MRKSNYETSARTIRWRMAMRTVQAFTLSCWEARWRASITMRDLAGSTRSHLVRLVRAVSLAELQKRTAERNAERRHPRSRTRLRCAARLTLPPTRPGAKPCRICWRAPTPLFKPNVQPAQGGTATPVDGVIHARYTGKERATGIRAELHPNSAERRSRLNGTISDNAALADSCEQQRLART